MDGKPAVIVLWELSDIPDGIVVDGAVAELTRVDGGTVLAEIRINGPAVP